ncbi:MAG: flippase-like domain-containing protein [Thermoplasmata archaeon]|nr:MAG: flippase-like domain-containing protein [Thermoplasmata archaeon]
MNKKVRGLVNGVISILLISFIIYLAGIEKIKEQFSQMVFFLFLLAVIIENIGVAISAKKWHVLFKMKEKNITFLATWKYYYIGSFFNAFLPTSIGGDAIKAYTVSKEIKRKENAFSSVIMDRITGLIAVLCIGSLALAIGWKEVPEIALLLSIPVLLLPSILIIITFKTDFIGNIIDKPFFSKFGKFQNFVRSVYLSLKEYGSFRKEIIFGLSISFFYHFLLIINNYVLSLSLGLHIPLSYFFIFIPVAEILVFLPITIQGFGVREGTYVILFSTLATKAQSFALGFSDQIVKVMVSIIGGIIYMVWGIKR